ncbi:type IV pilus biogenesis protein PilP [Pigmentiphaga sp.]|uniref:type IV pilus biogenesis protein PilP n=1 Tax=Pigmentiphaga sp. TaxID=1977564 RepID=UPI00128C3A13|nr:type IV pilus biogenesis protein PilP [Pigmentiphaga sp.]MPS30688.1 type IV pilus biogenesis protein PilP [Alcaligenaceae bacterium SAGV5]MPS50636.1 type IV pilus biogenesis protein PilP [Alcaligenaceae bacterium SAGV3]MPT55604.1 type IV pilus biogenesis protein PilP [Alcaligenaceae bacterium]
MRSKYLSALLMLAAWAAQPARAESTSDSLTRLEAETMVLKARERLLEVQASILGKQNEIAARQSIMATLNQAEVIGDPVVRAIEGVGGRLYATLQMSDGSIADVQQGDTLPGGMKVLSIAPREVMVQSGGRKIRLAAYAPGQAGLNPAAVMSGPGVARPGAGR